MLSRISLRKNQSGLVSIVVTLIIMLVLTLIVTGFAQLARREQREALDRQLSTQAAYAAESGINYARSQLEPGGAYFAENFEKDQCPTNSADQNIDSSSLGVIQFSCLLVTKKLSNLKYSNVQSEKSTVVPIIVNPLNSLTISWQDKDGTRVMPTAIYPNFPTPTIWGANRIGVLRMQIFSANTLNTVALDSSSFTVFGYPTLVGAGTVAYGSQQGQVIQANCSSPTSKRCSMTITNLPAGRLFLRMKSFYTASDVEICANTCNGSDEFSNAQIEIDSTGKANDVLRRTVVRVEDKSIYSSSVYKPEFTLDSAESICKLYELVPAPGTSVIAPGCI